MDHIRALMSSKSSLIFAATESWFTSDHLDCLVSINNCALFRDDRPDNRLGGGVAVWVASFLQPSVFRPQGNPFGSNSVWLIFHSLKICFVCIYIPPQSVIRFSHEIIEFITVNLDNLLSLHLNHNIIVTGDFNRLDTDYVSDAFELVNVVSEPTRGDVILDLVLLSKSLVNDYFVSVGPPVSTSDHRTIFCSPKKNIRALNHKFVTVYDLRDSYINAFIHKLSCVNFTSFYDMNMPLDDKVRQLSGIIEECFTQTIPSSTVAMSPKDKPYITPLLKSLINKRWNAYRRRDFREYNFLSCKVKALLKKEKLSWASKARKGAKELWKAVDEVKGTKSTRLTALDAIIGSYTSTFQATEDINTMFLSNQIRRPAPVLPEGQPINVGSSWTPVIEVDYVHNLISALKAQTSPGCDNIPTILYKKAAHLLAAPLAHIINISILNRRFPDPWKHSLIVPIPKSFPVSKDELRPISLLPVFSKICERAILDSGLAHQLRQAFGQFQFGNVPRSSTTAALVAIHERITSALDDNRTAGVVVIAYDFSKAFDQLGHDTIILALIKNNFPEGFIKWIDHYLKNRSQRVKLSSTVSSARPIMSGIPQGSVLGPFLFNLVVSSLCPLHERTTIVKYIDDCTFVIPISPCTTQIYFEEHQNMVEWSSSVGLRLNLRKCKSLWIPKSPSFTISSIPDITPVNQLKILGVHLTSDLKWTKQVTFINKVASSRMYALRVLKPLLDRTDMIRIYNALILSIIEYCSPLMVGMLANDELILNRIQRRAHRLICGSDCECERFCDLKQRRNSAAIKLLLTISNNPDHPLHPMCPKKSLRSNKFTQPVCRTSRRLNSFFPKTICSINGTFVD